MSKLKRVRVYKKNSVIEKISAILEEELQIAAGLERATKCIQAEYPQINFKPFPIEYKMDMVDTLAENDYQAQLEVCLGEFNFEFKDV